MIRVSNSGENFGVLVSLPKLGSPRILPPFDFLQMTHVLKISFELILGHTFLKNIRVRSLPTYLNLESGQGVHFSSY